MHSFKDTVTSHTHSLASFEDALVTSHNYTSAHSLRIRHSIPTQLQEVAMKTWTCSKSTVMILAYILKTSYKKETFAQAGWILESKPSKGTTLWTRHFQYLSHSLLRLEPSPVNERKQTEIEGSRFNSQGPKRSFCLTRWRYHFKNRKIKEKRSMTWTLSLHVIRVSWTLSLYGKDNN